MGELNTSIPEESADPRELFERITLPTEMLGTISPSRWLNHELTDGEKTVLPVSRTYTSDYLDSADGQRQPSANVLDPRSLERKGPNAKGEDVWIERW